MTRVILVGARGRMGQVVSQLAKTQRDLKVVAGLDRNSNSGADYPIYSVASQLEECADVILDFSSADGLETSLELALERGLPMVIAATGHSPEQLDRIRTASVEIPIFQSANLSLGINLLLELVRKATSVLGEGFDIEIIERHHNQKLDAPSGTALMIAQTISQSLPGQPELVYGRHAQHQRRSGRELGIHAVRGGTIVGEHEVLFAGRDETLSIVHSAQSKEIFAVGALKACAFLSGRPAGLYSMQDLVTHALEQ